MAVGFVASATSGSQASVASFNIGTLGTGARAGIVFVAVHNSSTDLITGVTWNGTAMTRLYRAVDTDTEPGSVVAYFLDNVTNGTITVSRTNNATVTVGYAASISTASVAAYVSQVITRVASTQNTNADTSATGTGASGEVAVNDGSPGSSSMRFAAAYSGAATPPAQGTNSTALQVLDSTAYGSRFVRETTAGQGSRNVGFATGTTDDWALVAVAVSEVLPKTITLGALENTPTLYAPTISFPPQTVTLGLLDGSRALYAPTLAPKSTITLPLLSSGSGATPTFTCGFEDTALTDDWSVSGTGASLSTSQYRTGAKSVEFAATGANSPYISKTHTATAQGVARFSIKFTSLPGTGHGDILLFKFDGVSVYNVELNLNGDNKLKYGPAGVGAMGVMADAVTTGVWYDIDCYTNGGQSGAWKVNGVDQPAPTWSSAETFAAIIAGPGYGTGGVSITFYVDDVARTLSASDYPIGDGYSTGDPEVWTSTAAPTLFAPVLEQVSGGTTQSITLGLLDGSAALYAPTVLPQPVTVTLGAIENTPVLYAPTLAAKNTLTLGLLDGARALYAPAMGFTVTLGLLDGARSLYQPTLAAKNTIDLGLLDSGSALYGPTITVGPAAFTLPLIDAGAALYAPTLTVGPVTISLGLIDGVPDLYAPMLLATNTLVLGLLDGVRDLYAPAVVPDQIIELSLLDSGAALYSPTVVGLGGVQTLTLGLLDAVPALYAPTLLPGPVTITLTLIDGAATLYAPTVRQTQAIALALLDAGGLLYAPTLIPGPVVVFLDLLESTPALYAPTLTIIGGAVTQDIDLGFLDGAGALYAPTLSLSGVLIYGHTKDVYGHNIPNATVDVFATATNTLYTSTTSGPTGLYSVLVQPGVEYFIVAYTAVAFGTSARDLVGT